MTRRQPPGRGTVRALALLGLALTLTGLLITLTATH